MLCLEHPVGWFVLAVSLSVSCCVSLSGVLSTDLKLLLCCLMMASSSSSYVSSQENPKMLLEELSNDNLNNEDLAEKALVGKTRAL